jgi:transcription elongation GreA/GreB family factor
MQQSLGLQQALQNARVFDASKVQTNQVNFGVRFVAENQKKKSQETYTVLGQFETDPDRNIISYNSPFMKQFVGKKAGDEIIISHPDGSKTPYKIISIEDALAGGEWDMPEHG